MATFAFRGFKGDYEIKLMDGANEIKSWTMNVDMDTQWICKMNEAECTIAT